MNDKNLSECDLVDIYSLEVTWLFIGKLARKQNKLFFFLPFMPRPLAHASFFF